MGLQYWNHSWCSRNCVQMADTVKWRVNCCNIRFWSTRCRFAIKFEQKFVQRILIPCVFATIHARKVIPVHKNASRFKNHRQLIQSQHKAKGIINFVAVLQSDGAFGMHVPKQQERPQIIASVFLRSPSPALRSPHRLEPDSGETCASPCIG